MSSKFTESVEKQASEWFVLMQSKAVTERERGAFLQWFDESIEHQEAFQAYELIWRDLGELAASAEGERLKASVNSLSGDSFFKRIQMWVSEVSTLVGRNLFSRGDAEKNSGSIIEVLNVGRFAVAGLALFVSVFLLNNYLGSRVDVHSFQTGIAQIQKINLDDGTLITLSARSRITAWSTESERHVELLEGQAFFEVAKNPEKPFYVKSGDTLIRVVGTQFDVNRTSSKVSIAVLEGVVNVSSILDGAAGSQFVVVTGGLQVSRGTDGNFSVVEKITPASFTDWRNGRLVYSNARLCDVIDDVNRYSQNKVLLDEALYNIRVTIAFDIGQVDSLPMLLSKMLPVAYTREASGRVFIHPSPK